MWYGVNVLTPRANELCFSLLAENNPKKLTGILHHFDELNNTKVENSTIQQEYPGPKMFQNQHISRWQKGERDDTDAVSKRLLTGWKNELNLRKQYLRGQNQLLFLNEIYIPSGIGLGRLDSATAYIYIYIHMYTYIAKYI